MRVRCPRCGSEQVYASLEGKSYYSVLRETDNKRARWGVFRFRPTADEIRVSCGHCGELWEAKITDRGYGEFQITFPPGQ